MLGKHAKGYVEYQWIYKVKESFPLGIAEKLIGPLWRSYCKRKETKGDISSIYMHITFLSLYEMIRWNKMCIIFKGLANLKPPIIGKKIQKFDVYNICKSLSIWQIKEWRLYKIKNNYRIVVILCLVLSCL